MGWKEEIREDPRCQTGRQKLVYTVAHNDCRAHQEVQRRLARLVMETDLKHASSLSYPHDVSVEVRKTHRREF
jgi:hypothetical protein